MIFPENSKSIWKGLQFIFSCFATFLETHEGKKQHVHMFTGGQNFPLQTLSASLFKIKTDSNYSIKNNQAFTTVISWFPISSFERALFYNTSDVC